MLRRAPRSSRPSVPNTFSMRIREWYSYHFPELVKIVNENYMYAKVAKHIKDRKNLTDESLEGLEEIVQDSSKAQAIIDASRMSMGMDISPVDLINIEMFASRVIALAEYRRSLQTYLQDKMENVAPNLRALMGDQVGARLISHAGSLTNLAKYPASTVQILGAEKALFRALKTKGNTPKYGLIFHSTFIGRAAQKNKGRISRFLANKCSIASRLDCFSDVPTSVVGEHLKEQVEDRLKFYETGATPRKNVDVMHDAIIEAEAAAATLMKKDKKKKKKDKKRKSEDTDASMNGDTTLNTTQEEAEEDEPAKKKKKKSKKQAAENGNGTMDMDTTQETSVLVEATESAKKKKKKTKSLDTTTEMDSTMDDSVVTDGSAKKKKKKKAKA